MLYLLDTNTVSYYLRRSSPALEVKLSEALQQHNVAISVITRAELCYGQAGMTVQDKRRPALNNFLLQLPSLQWSAQAADHYGTLKSQHKSQGMPIGEMDTLIAAHALAEKLILVTHNTRHFDKVPGLTLEDWMMQVD